MARIEVGSRQSIASGSNASDTFYVYGGNATLIGRGGNDHYDIYNWYNGAYGANIVETAGGGTDTVDYFGHPYYSESFYLADNVENLNLHYYADAGYGNSGNNVLRADAHDFYGDGNLFGLGGNDTLIGGREDDYLYGGDGADSANGGYGDDKLYGNAGNDTLHGGDSVEFSQNFDGYGYGGDDTLYGGAGDDVLFGGNDSITGIDNYGAGYAYAGSDVIYGGAGADRIFGGNDVIRAGGYGDVYGGNDTLHGGDGNDTITGGDNRLYGTSLSVSNYERDIQIYGGVDHLYGGDGDDVLRTGNTTLNGGGHMINAYGYYGNFHGNDGNDLMIDGTLLIRGSSGGGIIYVDGGKTDGDYFYGGAGHDTMISGNATVLGGIGGEIIYGGSDRMYGEEGNDSITGGNDSIDGGGSRDVVYGGGDNFYGHDGNDTMRAGIENLRGGAGSDTIYGGHDYLSGGDGNDLLVAGNKFILDGTADDLVFAGYSRLYGGDGRDTLLGANTGDTLYGEADDDVLRGNGGDDLLFGAGGNDNLDGGAGDDTLYGGGRDTLEGGTGDDLFSIGIYGGVAPTITDLGGNDTVIVHGDAGTFTAGAGIDNIIDHRGESAMLVGNELDNYIQGSNGTNDTLIGNGGDDVLNGYGGADVLQGGGGSDTYTVDSADDVVIEAAGAGTDTVLAYGAYGVLAANVENLYLATAANNGEIWGNSLNNLLVGNMYGNLIYGGVGADTLDGGAYGYPEDFLIGGAGNDVYIVNSSSTEVFEAKPGAAGGTDTVRSYDDFTLGNNLEHLVLLEHVYGSMYGYGAFGNALANRIDGNSLDNYMDGGANNDTMAGGGGDDDYIVDSTTDVVIEAAGGGDDSVTVVTKASSGTTFTLAANVEDGELKGGANLNLSGNASDNVLAGNSGANALNGGSAGDDSLIGYQGNDTLIGGAGDDTLLGGTGSDSMSGGTGDDLYFVDRGDGAGTAISTLEDTVVEALASGTDTVVSTVYSYMLTNNVENLELSGAARKGFGNTLNNDITGNNYNNRLEGGSAGKDTLIGQGGDDTLVGGSDADYLDGGSGVDSLDGGIGNDSLSGGTQDDTLDGGAGSDTLMGGDGNDVISGGLGNDTVSIDLVDYSYTGANAIIDLGAGTGYVGASDNDTISGVENALGGTGADTITGTSGNNRLDGGVYGNDSLVGGAGSDTLIGGAAYDTLDGGTGNDSMEGGLQDDTYWVDSAGDKVVEAADAGTDVINLKSLTTLTLTMAANVENLYMYGGDTIDAYGDEGHDVTGNALANHIEGDTGANSIAGGDGADELLGLDGQDVLLGGNGDDGLQGGNGNDSLSGDAGDDYLDGGSGNDTLLGGAGSDELIGGTGNDSMNGGAGDDLYWVDSGDGASTLIGAASEDTVVEGPGGGTDTVQLARHASLPAYVLAPNVENLEILLGSLVDPIVATGNTGNNLIKVLDRFSGSGDVFDGGTGNDTLDAQLNWNEGSYSVTTSSFERIELEVGLAFSDWTLATGNVAGQQIFLTGSHTGDSDLTLTGLNANADITLDSLYNGGAGNDQLTLQLQDPSGNNSLTLDVLHGSDANLVTSGIETLVFNVFNHDSGANAIDVAGVTGESLLVVTGAINDSGTLMLTGLDNGQDLRLQGFYSSGDMSLTLASGAGGNDQIDLQVDNAYVSYLSLESGLEVLNIDTLGDVAARTNGASFLVLNTGSATMDIVLVGIQDLTLEGITDGLDASGFNGDLDAYWSGDGSFTAGTGDDTIWAGYSAVSLNFGTELNDRDVIYDSSDVDGDTLAADLSGASFALDISNIEELDFSATADAFLDLNGVRNGTGTVDIDLSGAGSFTLFNLNSVGSYNISGALLTGGATLNVSVDGGGSYGSALAGGGGNDTLNGGSGGDGLTGGAGNDHFVFDDAPNASYIDVIADFVIGTDRIELSLTQFGDIGTVGSSMTAGAFVTAAGVPSAADADDRVLYDQTSGVLYYDADGNGSEAAVQFATLTGSPDTFSAADIFVIA